VSKIWTVLYKNPRDGNYSYESIEASYDSPIAIAGWQAGNPQLIFVALIPGQLAVVHFNSTPCQPVHV